MMNRILMAAAIAVVAGSPLALAAKGTSVNPETFSTRRCGSVESLLSTMKFGSAADRQTATHEALSLCRQNNDSSKRAERGGDRVAASDHNSLRR